MVACGHVSGSNQLLRFIESLVLIIFELEENFRFFVDLILYVPVNNFPVMSGRVFLGLNSTKLGLMFLAQGHNPVRPVRLETLAFRSRVKHSTTKPLRSL